MIQIDDKLWIGTSEDESKIGIMKSKKLTTIGSVLNVAVDLVPTVTTLTKLPYMQVGFIDGPGNSQMTYTAAIMTLAALLEKYKSVLVCCHTGSRSLAVVVMYRIIKAGMNSEHPTFLNYWIPWDKMVDKITNEVKDKLPKVHPAHKEVFDKMALSLIERLI